MRNEAHRQLRQQPTAGSRNKARRRQQQTAARRGRPRVVAAPSKLFDNNKPADIFISPHIPRIKKWDPIANDMLEKPPVDNVDYTHMIPGGLNRLLKRQGELNDRAMQNILGQAGRKVRREAKEKLLARQEEQRNIQAFHLLQDQGNKQKRALAMVLWYHPRLISERSPVRFPAECTKNFSLPSSGVTSPTDVIL
jgi:hypothetical protein